jgi:hypothetical protein
MRAKFDIDNENRNYDMSIGAEYNYWENLVCKAKIDDKFIISTSFKLNLSKNVELTISN